MIIDRESSSADPPQQLRERKNELILEPKDCGGGAIMSYMERESVCVCVCVDCRSFFQEAGRDGRRTLLSSLAWWKALKGSDCCCLSCLGSLQ